MLMIKTNTSRTASIKIEDNLKQFSCVMTALSMGGHNCASQKTSHIKNLNCL